MGLFSNSKHSNNSYILPLSDEDTDFGFKLTPVGQKSDMNVHHALTPEEVSGVTDAPKKETENIPMNHHAATVSPLEALKQRAMRNNSKNKTENSSTPLDTYVLGDNKTENTKTDKSGIGPIDIDEIFKKLEIGNHTLKEISKDNPDITAAKSDSVLNVPTVHPENDGTAKKITMPAGKTYMPEKSAPSVSGDVGEKGNSLLERCMPFIKDDKYNEQKKPKYTLPSVEEILGEKPQYNFTDELLKKINESTKANVTVIDKTVNESTANTVKTENIPMKADTDTIPIKSISDIDATAVVDVPVKNTENTYEDISSGTSVFDLPDEPKSEIHKLDSSDFAYDIDTEYVPDDEYNSFADAKRIGLSFIKKRRQTFVSMFLTVILIAALGIIKLPFMNYTGATFDSFSAFSVVILVLGALLNFDMFASIGKFFTKQRTADTTVAFTFIGTLVYSVFCMVSNTDPYKAILPCMICIFFKSIASFVKSSYILSNFKIIANKNIKNAFKFIDDKQTTYPMAKNSVDGDVLIGTGIKTTDIHDYCKNTFKDEVMNGRLGIFTVFALVVSLIAALFVSLTDSGVNGFYTLSVMLSVFFGPTIFFTDIMPLKAAATVLNPDGAMISGVGFARQIEECNAITVSSDELFPSGTVTLYNIKALDQNEFDRTLADAYAVTTEIKSPLNSIFASIVKSSDFSSGKADTVKYEENLGISGWVDDRHIFIGNRTLLEAHGIKTPPIELDHKILRNGYFPVYVACGDKPCALLIVKYSVRADIADELREICNLGVTVLVDTCDPNLTGQMICDYFNLYEDSVKVMSNSGSHIYHEAIEKVDSYKSGASYSNTPLAIVKIFNCATKIKRSVSFLSIYHIAVSVIISLLFFLSFAGYISLPNSYLFMCLYSIVSFIVSYIIYLFNRP